MNKVYISGKVVQQPLLMMEGETPHLVMTVRVAHRKRNGERRSEDYRVNAWNRVAQWGKEKLEQGQIIALQGYLTQNASKNHATEITVEEFLPLRFESPRRDVDAGNESAGEPALAAAEDHTDDSADAP